MKYNSVKSILRAQLKYFNYLYDVKSDKYIILTINH